MLEVAGGPRRSRCCARPVGFEIRSPYDKSGVNQVTPPSQRDSIDFSSDRVEIEHFTCMLVPGLLVGSRLGWRTILPLTRLERYAIRGLRVREFARSFAKEARPVAPLAQLTGRFRLSPGDGFLRFRCTNFHLFRRRY